VLFYDFSYPNPEPGAGKGHEDWQSEALVKMTRELMRAFW